MRLDRLGQGRLRGWLKARRPACLAPALALALLLLSWAPSPATAATPSHPRAPSLDVVALDHACGAAVDSKGDLYTSSAGAAKIKVFSPSDHETPIGEIANANEPCGLAVTSTGNLYVSEQATGFVVRYKPTEYPFVGKPSYGPREVIDSSGQAKGISVDPFDDRLYVAEGGRVSAYDSTGSLGENETQEVRCFQCTGGKYKLEFGGASTKSINFEGLASEVKGALEELTTIGVGNVSVLNGANDRIHLVTFVGKFAHTDVEALKCIPEGLEGGGAQECKITELTKSWSGHIGEGDLTEATGVAPYTYKTNASQITYSLAVADASGDQVKLFSAKSFTEQKLRRTLSGPKGGEEFGFGAEGAYLGSDRGTCPPSGAKACTAGHFFLYDDAHEVLDELEATGELVSQTPFAAGDGTPTATAVDRSGGAGNGTLYATSGEGEGARALAFGALGAPSRPGPLEKPLSMVLTKACSVAIDDFGNRYVAVGPEVFVYPPNGEKALAKIGETAGSLCRIAVDSEGNVYGLRKGKETEVAYFIPSSYPPKEGTTYSTGVIVAKETEFGGTPIRAIAVNSANSHLIAISAKQGIEYKSTKEGSGVLNKEIATSLGITTMFGVGVYGANGNIYVTNSGGSGSVYVLDPQGKEIITQINGSGSPAGSLGSNAGAIAVDQSNGHVIAFETNHKDLEEYEASGTFVAAFGSFEALVTTDFGVAVDNGANSPNKGDVYLAYDDPKGKFDLSAFGGLGYPPLEERKLTVKKTGGGAGTVASSPAGIECGKACSAKFSEGTSAVLSAKAEPGSEFEGWSGCEAEFEGKPGEVLCEVTMQADTEVTAEFKNIGGTFPLKVVLEGTGTGTVTSSPDGIDCEPTCEAEFGKDSTVTLIAEPDPGSEVEGWVGCDAEPSPTECEVTMDEAKEVKAIFGSEHPLLTVEKKGTGSGEVTSEPPGIDCGSTCSAKFDLEEEVTLSAEANSGSEFAGWQGCDAEPSPSECEVKMEGPMTVMATFTELPQAFVKPPAPLAYTEATLRGEVGPAGLPTKYHFEYLTQIQYEANGETFTGAKFTPTEELAPAKGLVAVSAKVSGLAKGTVYRFRLLVENEAGSPEAEGQFTTLEEAPVEICPNAALRTGLSANLPDCRAYELVSPPEDGGYTVGWGPGSVTNNTFRTALAAQDGDSVIFETYGGPLPEVGGNGVQNGYRASRGAGGWGTASYGPTYAQSDFPGAGGVSPDQIYSFWLAVGKSGTLDPKSADNARYLALPQTVANPACGPEAPGRFELIGCGSEGEDPEAIGRWISPDAEHVVFTSGEQLEPDAPEGKATIYDRSAGSHDAQVVSLLPGDETPNASASYEGVSADGSAVAFTIGGILYVRVDDSETLEVGPDATFAGLSADGSALFYLQGGALHRFDTEEGISIEIAPGGSFVNVPAGGTSAYFTSTQALAEGAAAGKDNLYLWEAEGDATRFVAVLAHGDVSGTQSPIKNSTVNLAQWVVGLDPKANGNLTGPAIDPSRTTPDGQVLLFQSIAPLTGYDSKGNTEIFRYDAAADSLGCISCGPEGTTADSDAQLQDEAPGSSPIASGLAPIANLSTAGDTALFTTPEPLVIGDHNGVADVYEWHEGRISLISSGKSAYPSYLYAVSASGDDVFFATREALVAGDDEDGGSQSIYDARVNGGFPAPGGGGSCEGGEACRGVAATPPSLPSPPTTSLPPEGTPTQPLTCPKGKHKVKRDGKVHCAKKHKAKKHGKHQKKHRRRGKTLAMTDPPAIVLRP